MERRYGRGRNQFYQRNSNNYSNNNRDNNVEESPRYHQQSSNNSSYSKQDNNYRGSNTSPTPDFGQRASSSFSARHSSTNNSEINNYSSASALSQQSLSQDTNRESEHTRPVVQVNTMMESGLQGDFSSITSNDLATTQRVLSLIHKEFKVFECFSCSNNFGYQLKKDPNIKFCTSECLTAGLQKVDEILKGRVSQLKSQDASPLLSPSVLTPSSRMNNGFSELGGGGVKSSYPTGFPKERNDDGAKARLLSTLQTGGMNRNGRPTTINTTPTNNNSDRMGGRLSGGNSRPTFNPSDNPFYRGEDRVDKARDEVDYKKPGPTQAEIDAAFSRNPAKEAIEKAGFSTVEQKEREGFLKLARTKKSDVKVEEEVTPPAKNNPLFEKPQLKTISSTSVPTNKDQFKPSQVVPQIVKPQNVKTPAVVTIPKIIKPQQQQQQENIPPKPKAVEVPQVVTKVSSPVKKIWNMKDVMTSTSIYDLAPCVISFQWSSTKFTISASADQAKRDELQMEISKQREAPAMTRVPAVNDIVIAPYFEDYYRGKVVKVDEKSKSVNVSFIDFGDCADVNLSECKEPTDEIMKTHPIYGVVFSLALNDVEVPKDFELPADVSPSLEAEMEVTVKIESKEKLDDWKGTLFLSDKRSLNEVVQNLLRPKTVTKPTPVPATPAPKPQATNGVPSLKKITKPVEAKAPTPSTSKPTPPTPEPKESQPTPVAAAPPPVKRAPFLIKTPKPADSKATPPPPVKSKYNVNTIKLSPLLDNEAMIQLNYIWTTSKINISAIDDLDKLESLQGLINAHVAKAPSLTKNPQVGDIVLAFYGDQYYRGKVAGIKDDKVNVIFLDYGDETHAPLAEIKEPTDEIMAHPIYGVVLKIDGLPDTPPVDGPEIDDVLETGGQLQVEEKTDNFTWKGEIWFGEDKSWTSINQAQGN